MLHKTKYLFLLLTTLLVTSLSIAQVESDPGTASKLSESELAARELALEMAALLGNAQKWQVDLLISYDTMQEDGQKIEFGERRRVSVERPSHILNELQASDGKREAVLFDGKNITVSEANSSVYARTPQPGDIDATVMYFLGDLGMRLPLAAMMMSQFPAVLEARMRSIEFVEETNILGEPTSHLAGRTIDVDFQVWISSGERPLPLRIVLTYREAPGQPQFRANFANWNFEPKFAADTFRFTPPAGASEIPLLGTLGALAGSGANSAATTTESGE